MFQNNKKRFWGKKMIVNDNVKILNNKFEDLEFNLIGNEIRIIESKPFFLNNNEYVKDFLKKNLYIKFKKVDGDAYWYINVDTTLQITNKLLKFEPELPKVRLEKKLYDYIHTIKEVILMNSIKVYLDKYNEFFVAPAAVFYHHAYKHGLLEHTVQVIQNSLAIKTFNKIKCNKDILIAGALLHDIGKVFCYAMKDKQPVVLKYIATEQHVIRGCIEVSKSIRSEYIDDIIHIIASHHNTKEFGSPVSPQSIEAKLVNIADNISSQLLG